MQQSRTQASLRGVSAVDQRIVWASGSGGTWLRTNDIEFATGRGDNRMKAGAGFGFRFKTPVFPIRLDFAIPLNPRNTDDTRQGDSRSLQPYFTIGNIF